MDLDSIRLVVLAVITVAFVWAKYCLLTGRLVSRARIEEASRERDEWREATRRNTEEVEEWRRYHDHLRALVSGAGDPMHFEREVKTLRTQREANLFSLQLEQMFAPAAMAPLPKRTPERPATSGCRHEGVVDVEISTGETVARWCGACETTMVNPHWLEHDLVDEEKRMIRDTDHPPCGSCGGLRHEPGDHPWPR